MVKMNKFISYGSFAMVALLASCATEDEYTDGNYDEARGVVKTEFTISIPSKAAGTRMTTAIVQGQATPVFRGIGNIELYPFSDKVAAIEAAPTTTAIPTPITLKGTTSGAITTLSASELSDANVIGSGNLFADNNSHLYQDIEVAIGTKAFMFYGVASSLEGTNSFTDGALTKTVGAGGKLSDITFNLSKTYGGSLGDNATSIENYLTGIANAKDNENNYWSESENVILKALHESFITMKAGSWTSVKAAVQQLYESLWRKSFADAVDNSVKNAILTAIKTTYADDEEGSPAPDGILEFQELDNFPATLGLPDGAIHMNWEWVDADDESLGKKFRIMSTTSVTDNSGMNISDLNKYVYPASLYYRALSNIRTANESKLKYYQTGDNHQTTWANVISQYGAEVTSGENQNDMVKQSTRSIAIVDQVQYAVGRLDVTVSTSAASLNDNGSNAIPLTHDDNEETVNNFIVTGILIGNQRAVNYKFEPVAEAEQFTIYDKTIEGNKYLRNVAVGQLIDNDKIHTLVLETPVVPAESPTDEQITNGKVKIAVEFLNNSGLIFFGQAGNVIYPGTKFYLVGEFDPTNTTANTANPNSLRQAFKQDYTTTANLVINSLANAYNTLPDLRAPQLELGLSVDLTWQNGITQTVNIY